MNVQEHARLFGERLRELRRKKGLSQEELAFAVECDVSTIGRIERAEKSPTLSMLFSIASALGVNLSELLDCQPADEKPGLPAQLRQKLDHLIEEGSKRKLEAASLVMDGLIPYGKGKQPARAKQPRRKT